MLAKEAAMKNKFGLLLVALFISSFTMISQTGADSADIKLQQSPSGSQDAQQDQLENPGQQSVKGTIDTITKDKISLKTDEGEARNFTINPIEQREFMLKGLKPGDRILVSFNQEDQIVVVEKIEGRSRMENKPKPLHDNQSGSALDLKLIRLLLLVNYPR